MSCFDYPLDSGYLLQKKNKLRRELLAACGESAIKTRIAILGGSTVNEVADQLRLFLLHHRIDAEFYLSEYGKYWEEAVFCPNELKEFRPDFVYIHTNWRNITQFPAVGDTAEQIGGKMAYEYGRLEQAWDNLFAMFPCTIIQNNFERPDYRLLGNRDVWDHRGRSHFIAELNQKLYEYAESHERFYINDMDYLAGEFGTGKWNDPVYWNMYKYAMHMQAIPYVAKSVADIVKSLLGKNKKLLALDLDNTLWGGVISEDGLERIAIGPEVPAGEAYYAFQNYCKELKRIGVILAVDSKNDLENAIAGLTHPGGSLRPADFVSIKANWNPKSQNLYDMAQELDLGMDSFVFVDDNPAEREIIRQQAETVSIIEADKVEEFIRVLDRSGYFEVTALSDEDSKKTDLYAAKALAKQQETAFSDYGAYLDSLDMTAQIRPFDDVSVQRIAQLTNKSNQFNLTTRRCTEADIEQMERDPGWITLYGSLRDKFTQHGIVTVMAGEAIDGSLHIRLWLMSCRVLKRDLEYAVMDTLVSAARAKGLDTLTGYYIPTAKNAMVKEFYGNMGFTCRQEDPSGTTVWELDLRDYCPKNNHIEVEA